MITTLALSEIGFGQTTGLAIYQPTFATQQAGWTTNGSASFGTVNSATALILNPSTGNQAGSGFWNQKITLPTNGSFSAFFTFQIDQNNSRADGFTFIMQQAGTTALGSTGQNLGIFGISGTSIAIEFDTYQNGGDPDNNHIALDLNGNTTHSNGVVASIPKSTLDLADGNLKYVWIDYNGATSSLQVRISYSNSRPATATLSTTSYNLSTMFANHNVYVGFTGATGGAYERHSITSFDFINQYSPITTRTNSYAQDPLSVTMTSSTTSVNDDGTTQLPITITLLDAGGAPLGNQPVTVSITSGQGTLSTMSGTTNSSGQLVDNLSTTRVGTMTVTSVAGYGGVNATKDYTGISILPILISDFTGQIQNTETSLSWDITSVDNGKDIVILRSADGYNFDSIGVVTVNGQLSLLGQHTYDDQTPLPGKNYYRLQLVNADGTSSFSNIVGVTFGQDATTGNITILGNPLTSELRLSGITGDKGMVVIYDAMGRIMQESSTQGVTGILSIACNNLPRGQYFAKVIQNNASQTLPFVKL
ncbi:MAG TPA: Ig-like domain-containing protein [Puia sp.]|nr:Ig-like domain-containing protein [Puia sp.]